MIPTIPDLANLATAAAEDNHHHFDAFEYGSTVVNFLVFFGFLAWVLRKPLAVFLQARHDNMAKALEEAKVKQAEAEQRLQAYTHKLEHMSEEVERIIGAFKKEAEADRVRLRQDSDQTIERLIRETEFTIRQETRKAEKAVRESAVQATLEAAEEIIKTCMTGSDQNRLADVFITHLMSDPTQN